MVLEVWEWHRNESCILHEDWSDFLVIVKEMIMINFHFFINAVLGYDYAPRRNYLSSHFPADLQDVGPIKKLAWISWIPLFGNSVKSRLQNTINFEWKDHAKIDE